MWDRVVGYFPEGVRKFAWVPLVLVALPLASYVMPRCNGGFEPAMQALNACGPAIHALGAPIDVAPVGLSCGSSETRGGGFGHAQWRMRVGGPKGSATYRYAAESHGGQWRVTAAELSLGGKTLNVLSCAPGAAAAAGEYDRLAAGATWKGRVTKTTGKSPVRAGEACAIEVSPSDDRYRSRGYNCHAKVTCGSAVLYGWEGSGMTRCRTEDGRLLGVLDDTGAAENDDPRVNVEPARKRAVVSDNAPGADYEIVIEME